MQKIIAVDFDGCLVTNKFPEVGEPIEKNIKKLKEEQKAGAKVILWTCRTGDRLQDAIGFCLEHGIYLDKVNENTDEIKASFDSCSNKIFANEYWDDRAVLMTEKDIGDCLSDGFHTFNDLYEQRRVLTAALVLAHESIAWKSHRHSDGGICFGGGWFIVGFDTPAGQYTYHYEDEYWDIFQCKEVELAPEWDGHTSKDVARLLSIQKDIPEAEGEESNMGTWAEKEMELACKRELEADQDGDSADYGCSCYRSAHEAFKTLLGQGHSGFSITMTQNILNRLIEGKPLTPIEDTPDVWNDITDYDPNSGKKTYQCKRMSAFFKYVYADGTVSYHDVDRFICVDMDDGSSYGSGLVSRNLNEMFPISIPYMPATKSFKAYCKDILTDRKNGDYDTVGIFYILKPDGERVEINRFFKEDGGAWKEIDQEEYNLRQIMHDARAIDEEKAYQKVVKEREERQNGNISTEQ